MSEARTEGLGLRLWRLLRHNLWPRPRQAFRIRQVLPLLIFVGLFLGVLFWVQAEQWLALGQLSGLWLLGLLPWLLCLHLASYSGLSRGRAALALWSRMVLVGLFALIFCEPRALRRHDSLSLIFAVDNSASMSDEAKEAALEYLTRTVAGTEGKPGKPDQDKAGLVFFGRNAAVEMPPEQSVVFDDAGGITANVEIDRNGTDLAQALSLAAAMLPEESPGRIVLVSDGVTTEGPLSGVLDDLHARKIPVDVLPVSYQYEHEVWLERMELPRRTKLGQPFEAAVILSSLKSGRGTLTLRQNGELIHTQEVSFAAGKNRFALPVTLKNPGYYEYSARIETPKGMDNWLRNNQTQDFLMVQGRGKILMVVKPGADPRSYEALQAALELGSREVQRITPFELPNARLALLPYDCIIFNDVPRDDFDAMQLRAVHDAVKEQGSGLIMLGGPDSYGPGGYAKTDIERALPVTMDIKKKKILPKSALAIILHTCEFADGNTWAKRISKEAIKVLNEQDEVGLLAFTWQGSDDWIFDLTPVSEYASMVPKINNAQIGDMPAYPPTMELAYTSLKNSDAAGRHVIIISDGDGSPPPPALLRKYMQAKISISTVAVFPHNGANGTAVMRQIARATGGRFYFPKDPNQLPRIFIKEAKTLRRSAVQEVTFLPEVYGSSPILNGLRGLPTLHGFVWTSPKEDPKVNVILEGPEKEEPDPVLATWRYGIGAAAAFTSDLSPRWARDWINWDQYSAFVRQLVTEVSRAGVENDIGLRTYRSGSRGRIVVDAYKKELRFLDLLAEIEGPDGQKSTVPLRQVGPNRYEAPFPIEGHGRYEIKVAGKGSAVREPGAQGTRKEVRAFGGLVVSYSDEFRRFRADQITMERIRDRTGGRVLNGLESGAELFDPNRQPRISSRSIIGELLLLLSLLVVVDVGLRRVHLDLLVIKGWFGLNKAARTETLGSLLELKQSRADKERGRREDAAPPPVEHSRPEHARPRAPTEAVKKHAERATEKPADTGTTTSRLLAAKRRAQGKGDKGDPSSQ